MKTNIYQRSDFISYRSHLLTKAIGKHFFLGVILVGCLACSQIQLQFVSKLDDTTTYSISSTDDKGENASVLFEEIQSKRKRRYLK